MIDIDTELRAAMKRRDSLAVSAYRAVKAKAGLKLTEAGRGGEPVSENEWMAIIRREIKERKESNEYRDPGAADYVADQGIVELLEKHLPRRPTPEETDALIDKVVAKIQPAGPKDMGKVMAALRHEQPGLDMALASAKVKQRLAKGD